MRFLCVWMCNLHVSGSICVSFDFYFVLTLLFAWVVLSWILCICFNLFYYIIILLMFVFFSKEAQKKMVLNLDGRRCGENIKGVGWGETMLRIRCINIFNKRKIEETKKFKLPSTRSTKKQVYDIIIYLVKWTFQKTQLLIM